MKQVRTVTGTVCPLDRADVDTDQIIPKQFLKRVDRDGFGPFAFHGWRYDDDGRPDPSFPMNRPEHAGATILLAGANFGCGSSREHAVWALEDAGFDAVIAPTFADIFRNNCTKVGVVTVPLDTADVRRLFDLVADDPDLEVTVDVAGARVEARHPGTRGTAFDTAFDIDPHVQHRLLHGLDDIDLTLEHVDAIDAYERRRPEWLPAVR